MRQLRTPCSLLKTTEGLLGTEMHGQGSSENLFGLVTVATA